jgi:sugar/nucleoside kinase (ribokinase family)
VDLVCVGDVMLDIRVDAQTLQRGGDVHGRVVLQPGGTSANAAVWGAWSGASARVHGRIGADLAGRTLDDALRSRGIEPALTVDEGAPTGTMLVIHEPGERSMVADRGANARLRPSDLPDVIEAGSVLVSGYLLLQERGHAAAVATLERAHAPFVAVEAASWPMLRAFGRDRFLEETAGADVVFANELEAGVLTGLDDGVAAATALGERYRFAAVKLGDRGAALVADANLTTVPAPTVAEVDPTGAGDAFDGVFLAGLARDLPPDRALEQACRAGALVAGSASVWPVGRAAGPTLDESASAARPARGESP